MLRPNRHWYVTRAPPQKETTSSIEDFDAAHPKSSKWDAASGQPSVPSSNAWEPWNLGSLASIVAGSLTAC
jgi:hypothetical protein